MYSQSGLCQNRKAELELILREFKNFNSICGQKNKLEVLKMSLTPQRVLPPDWILITASVQPNPTARQQEAFPDFPSSHLAVYFLLVCLNGLWLCFLSVHFTFPFPHWLDGFEPTAPLRPWVSTPRLASPLAPPPGHRTERRRRRTKATGWFPALRFTRRASGGAVSRWPLTCRRPRPRPLHPPCLPSWAAPSKGSHVLSQIQR